MNNEIYFQIIVWLVGWFVFWGIFNFALLANFSKNQAWSKIKIVFYLITNLILAFYLWQIDAAIYHWQILVIILVEIWGYFSKRSNSQRFSYLFIHVTLQQYAFIILLLIIQPLQNIAIVFATIFTLAHAPVYMLKHITKKGFIIMTLTVPLGGWLLGLTYANRNLAEALIINTFIHLGFYLIIINAKSLDKTGIVV
jgi:hypothetical protein